MHGAVLANLELGQVKAECLHLPDELLQLAKGLTWSTRRDERCLNTAKVVEQLIRSSVRERQIGTAGCADPVRNDEEELSIRLPGRARCDVVRARGGNPMRGCEYGS